MSRKLTQQEFIERSKKIFNNIDYSKVAYAGSNTRVILICKLHGSWQDVPKRHINQKMGCPICRGAKNNTQTFIDKSKTINGDRFEYSKTVFVNNASDVIITCKIHGDFKQRPNDHLSGKGCAKCSVAAIKDADYFFTQSKIIHNDKYNYSSVNYINMETKVTIICYSHGEFQQSPRKHINRKQNCPKCDVSATKDENYFLTKSKIIHNNKYDYSLVNYVRMNIKVNIICPKHGMFKQTPQAHTSGKNGCPSCSSKVSAKETKWLDSLFLPKDDKHRSVVFLHLNKRVIVDGYDPITNTIYEFNGDYWHGNPAIYSSQKMNKTIGKTYSELYQKTLDKEKMLKDAGYNIVSIWESDWDKINEKL